MMILLVEDNRALRSTIEKILADEGYPVLAVADPIDALQAARRSPRPIELMLSDVLLPYMTGLDLAVRLTDMFPGMKILFMSGYSKRSLFPPGRGVRFIEKPFTLSVLLRQVAALWRLPAENVAPSF